MADIRFKISGDTPTFVARLYDSTKTVLQQEKYVNYSGTCVIFNALLPSTYYFIKVCDSIGNLATGCTLSSNWSGGTQNYANKSISMGGAVTTPNQSNSFVGDSGSLNHLIVSPSLSFGQSVNVNFCAQLCANQPSFSNAISIFCKSPSMSNYGLIWTNEITEEPFIGYNICVPFNYGDSVCYEMASSISSPAAGIFGYADLSISALTNPVGFSPIIGSPSHLCTCATSTCSPPPPSQKIVSFLPTVDSPNWYQNGVCSRIVVTPELSVGESFRVSFINSASADVEEIIPKPVSACAYYICNATHKAIASVTRAANNIGSSSVTYPIAPPPDGYVDINAYNVNDIRFYATAISNAANSGFGHGAASGVEITQITPQVGCFALGTCHTLNVVLNTPNPV